MLSDYYLIRKQRVQRSLKPSEWPARPFTERSVENGEKNFRRRKGRSTLPPSDSSICRHRNADFDLRATDLLPGLVSVGDGGGPPLTEAVGEI